MFCYLRCLKNVQPEFALQIVYVLYNVVFKATFSLQQ
jgi:hypothetical protein